MNRLTKAELLKKISDLLDLEDCSVRIQREMSHEQFVQLQKRDTDAFVIGKRVTIIVVGTTK
jgi:hypothetical protein